MHLPLERSLVGAAEGPVALEGGEGPASADAGSFVAWEAGPERTSKGVLALGWLEQSETVGSTFSFQLDRRAAVLLLETGFEGVC